ncbi:50S ribosomal protein L25/general stress protein Ctc [Oleiagrimonas sp. C23AA]|uniref:50S ribosomal protein L25/general stress protein Ctc n=1 Tax=Oleiagrimonas sp. C23AA TaxID=2719047 RepID=UPI001420223B|nr:50S ribosomal protein L25/general stress protein Ctc [Oleiagrimonas sp. C23AA]NII11590.1 50S ribosomal protein L25/general stress protein Ctc [Oleiagrimonas sp. C23AA]
MTQVHEVVAERREDQGKGASRRLRHSGMVPAIVYGNNKAPESIQIEHRIVLALAKHEWFFSSVLDLKIEGESQKVLLRDWQKHPYKQQMMHMDFMRIDENAKIHTNVPLHFLNQDKSPAGKATGIVVSHNITEIEVVCLAKDLPEYIEVDLSDMDEGHIVHLSDLKMPAGVEIEQLKHGPEHDLPVVTAQTMRGAVSSDDQAEGDEAASEE